MGRKLRRHDRTSWPLMPVPLLGFLSSELMRFLRRPPDSLSPAADSLRRSR